MSAQSPLFPIAFPFFFAGMWTGVSYLLSRLSGWSALAERYRTGAAPAGERLPWMSARIGSVSFRSCLNATLAPAGLHLVPLLPFRLFMPPLLIPWTEIRFEGFSRYFFNEFACFRLGAQGPVFAVFQRKGERLRAFLPKEALAAFESRKVFAESLIDSRTWIIAAAAAAVGIAAAVTAMKR
jgi:hypothetical protein